jgi:hypothetical protein
LLKQLPPGITPPLILAYNASSVPIIQLAMLSGSIPEQGLFDLANKFVRTQLAGVAGASIPFPYGGKQRQIQVDLDQRLLQEHGVSANDGVNAVNAQNQIIPAGTAKVGEFKYNIKLNGSPIAVEEFNDLPIKTVNGTVVYIHDVAHVRGGSALQSSRMPVSCSSSSRWITRRASCCWAATPKCISNCRSTTVASASPPMRCCSGPRARNGRHSYSGQRNRAKSKRFLLSNSTPSFSNKRRCKASPPLRERA